MNPRGLCGLDGCVYTKGHTCDHSWMRPFDRPTCRNRRQGDTSTIPLSTGDNE